MLRIVPVHNSCDFEGSRKVTCKEATELLLEGKLRKAWFRPYGIINYLDPDQDDAFVWFLESK
jgi:hypothetical protein